MSHSYWEDINLIKKINKSNFKMVLANNIFLNMIAVNHLNKTLKLTICAILIIYMVNLFMILKIKVKNIKILRKLLQNFLLLLINLVSLNFKNSLLRIYILIGILKFILYYMRVIIFK